MDKMPIRRKYKDNPYTINKDGITNKYYIKFKDSTNKEQLVEVDATIYKVFDDSELIDISHMHEYERHIEHNEMFDYKIDLVSSKMNKSTEEIIEEKMLHDELKSAIKELSEVQKRRIKMYYFEDLNLKEIAEIECCSIKNIHKSIEQGLQNLRKKLKK